jgi:transcriptional regulator with XRE-family HTH domain
MSPQPPTYPIEPDVYDATRIIQSVGRKLSRLRNQNNLLQEELAKLAGIGQPQISKIEICAYRRVDYLEAVLRLAKFYKLHPGVLMFGDMPLTNAAQAVATAFDDADESTRAAVLSLLKLPA